MVLLNAENAQSEDDFAGNSRPLPGRYHSAVLHAEEKGSKKKGTPGLEIEFQTIVNGIGPDGQPNTGQSGRTIPLFLSYVGSDDSKTQTCINRVTRLALCCGVLQPGQAAEPDWNDAIGRELVIEVESQDYEDQAGAKKSGSQVSFMGFWSLGNKEVANVPKDSTTPGMQQLAKTGEPINHPANGNGNGNATNGATAQAAAGSTATRKPRGKFSDL
jgi:hypothetical protein